jgi:orotidine-5'-phosphate decarboxylase
MMTFTERLAERVLGGMRPACVGFDPRLDALPGTLAAGASAAERIVAFAREVLPAIARTVPAFKPNIAFFECHGAAGFDAYETVCRLARDAGLLVIGDVKRGDIGSTARAYAEIHCAIADAVTVHPYLGRDGVDPFLEFARSKGCGVFVLVRTSNPSATEFQDLVVGDGETLADAVASAVTGWGRELVDRFGYSAVGAVVGATWPTELRHLRSRLPQAWLLLPGVGAQGGRIEDLAAAFDARGLGALVSQSRGVLQCFSPTDRDWLDRVESALAAFVAGFAALSPPRCPPT